jgi:hypothetical protein
VALLRCEQWRDEGLPATLGGLRRVRYGVTAHLCGEILDYRFEGPSQVLARGELGGHDVLAEAASVDTGEVVVARVPLPASPLAASSASPAPNDETPIAAMD